jgi:transposase
LGLVVVRRTCGGLIIAGVEGRDGHRIRPAWRTRPRRRSVASSSVSAARLAVCYEAGLGGFALWRLLSGIGATCDVVAPSLIPVRAGDRVKTDLRDAKKLVELQRAGLLRYVIAPSTETEGLRDLLRCRDDLRCARTAACHRVLKALLRHGRIFRDGTTTFTLKHRRWVNAQRLDDPSRSSRC